MNAAELIMARYNVFLSYIMEDAEVMWRVYNDLQIEGLDVWIDQTSLEPGTLAWDRTIEDAIVNSGCLVVILSPQARISEWVREELHYAKILNKRIFPLLALGEAHDAIPFGFSTAQYTDIRDEHHYEDGIKKLIAAICKNQGVESRTAQSERISQQKYRADQLRHSQAAFDEARSHTEEFRLRRREIHNEIKKIENEEKELQRRTDYLMVQRQHLYEEDKIVYRQHKQAEQHQLNMAANLQSLQDSLGIETKPEEVQLDWSTEMPYLAELSYNDTEETQAVWHDISTDEQETVPDTTHYMINGRRVLPEPRKHMSNLH